MSRSSRVTLQAIAVAFALLANPQAPMAANKDNVMPLPTTRVELSERLVRGGLSLPAIQTIVAASRDALVLETTLTEDAKVPLGASKFGGHPDLPKEIPWAVRSAYEGAEQLARQYEEEAANLYADSGLLAPWLPEQDGKALIVARKQLKDDAMAGTLKIMKDAGIDTDALDLGNLPAANPDEIAAEARELRAKAKAVTKPFPLTFIAQIDLAALSREPGFDPALPKTGRLLLFYDLPILPADFEPRSKAGWQLIYDETPVSQLQRVAPPKELLDLIPSTQLRSAAVKTSSVVTTVPTGDAGFDALQGIAKEDTALYHNWLFTLGWPTDNQGHNHQLGGWPRAIQSGMQSRSQLAANGIDAGTGDAYQSEAAKRLIVDAKAWHLVVQIGTDEAIGYTLPGSINVLVREEDLAMRRFDRAWIVYEQD
ncbi:DUF1963 domain-containing protein (plasmid) [Phyllobacterium sp. 628]|uniref:DUF1963 domain-containing protein n=1 Tax=Phyllobacterium sp. 628 TaxID=2718938 RepID=UPI0016628BE4|nr:YwqG family protein [Phyllobacterium sp. 628]QND54573.1 DUF1963 domain-containing protein [Phyllobacterium sp. 628]